MLEGKVILVTGSARGIGRETALLLAKNRARLVINYCHSEADALSLRDEIQEQGSDAIVVKADVGCREEVQAMFKTIRKEYKQLDVLVNNAGILIDSLILMAKEEDYDRLMHINLKGSFLCMQYASKMMMRKQTGKIINISSIIGRYGNAGQTAYGATKAGVLGMTFSAAKELGRFGITVNAIAPGVIDTDMIAQLKPEFREKLLAGVSLGRIGTPEDIAKVVLFLSSSLSDYISGQVIGVDGGQTI